MKRPPRILLILLCCSLLLNGYFVLTRNKQDGRSLNTVSEIVDGDTVMVDTGERVKLLGVDAPELDRCLGPEAREALSALVLYKPVRMTESRSDHFNRTMALVYVNELLVNTELIRLGFAKPDYTSNSEKELFKSVYAEAKRNKLGIHSETCKNVEPTDARCVIKGNIDKASGKKLYHLPTCRHYDQIVIDTNTAESYFCTEQEAEATGFSIAPDCLR